MNDAPNIISRKINANNPDVANGCGMMLGDYMTLMDHLENVANGGSSFYYGYAASAMPEGETIQDWATNLKNRLVADTIISKPELKEAILDPSYDQVQAAKKANPGEYVFGNIAAAIMDWYGMKSAGAKSPGLAKGTGEGYNGNGGSVGGTEYRKSVHRL